MKVYGKKTIKIDCTWEFEDNAELRVKLESFSENELIDYCFENGKFEEGEKMNPQFKTDYIGESGDEFDF
jgi:hypothetical protein